MMRQVDLDGDEEMGPQVEEVVEMDTNGSMLIGTGEGLGDSSSKDSAISNTVIGEDGKTFLNLASLGRAPKPKPHPRFDSPWPTCLPSTLNTYPIFSIHH